MNDWWILTWWAGGALAIVALGVILFALFRDRSRGRRRCPKCWYDMSGAPPPDMKCPECGRTQRKEMSFFRTRRRWSRVLAGVALLGVACATFLMPAAVTGKWAKYTPMPLLRFGLSFFDREANDLFVRTWNRGAFGNLPAYERLLMARAISNDLRLGVKRDDGAVRATHGQLLLWALPQLGDEVKPALPELAAALASHDPILRRTAVDTHRGLGARALPNVPAVRALLLDRAASLESRCAALLTLVEMGASDQRTIKAVHAVAEEADDILRLEAASALIALDPASPETLETLISVGERARDSVHQVVVARELGWYAHSREVRVIPASLSNSVVSQLDYGSEPRLLRRRLSTSSTKFPTSAPCDRAIKALAAMLAADDMVVRITVANVLAGVDEGAASAAAELRRGIDTEQHDAVRRAMVRAYTRCPTADVTFLLDELRASLTSVEADIREWAVSCLCACGPRAASLVPDLKTAFIDADEKSDEAILEVLASMGEPGWEALNVHMSFRRAGWGARAAKWLGVAASKDARAAEYLYRALTAPEAEIRAGALSGLAEFEGGEEKLAALRHVLAADPAPWVRAATVRSASRLRHEETFIDFCTLALGDPEVDVQLAVIEVLSARAKSDAVRLRLEQIALTGKPAVRAAARQALDRK